MILCGSYVFLTKSDFYGIFFYYYFIIIIIPHDIKVFPYVPSYLQQPGQGIDPFGSCARRR
jgi:hypothetical protein